MTSVRVLLVDDDPAVLSSLSRLLEVSGGYEVRAEGDGRRAVEVARAFRPDVVLLDILAREWDGGDVAAEIESDPELAGVAIAFLSGLVSEDDLADGLGVDPRGRRLLPKTLGAAALIAAVRGVLAQAPRGGLPPRSEGR